MNISRKGERYSIKTLTYPTNKKTGTFYGLNPPDSNIEDTILFEYVIVVQINDELGLLQILEIDWSLFLKHKKWSKRMKAWFLNITSELQREARILIWTIAD